MSVQISCGDGGCVFGHPGGMHTNGGCKCLMGIMPHDRRLSLRDRIRALRAERDQARAECDEWEGVLRGIESKHEAVKAERDQARAELDSALTELEQYGEAYANVDPVKPGQTTEQNMLLVIRERDQARAEVERLRAIYEETFTRWIKERDELKAAARALLLAAKAGFKFGSPVIDVRLKALEGLL